jgi:RNA polymerase sigma factor (sigma-70 family)
MGMDTARRAAWVDTEAVVHAALTPEALVDAYLARVHRFAVLASSSDADPEDLAQQAMLHALEALHRFDPSKGTPDAWLWRIVVNLAASRGRVARRREFLIERLIGERGGAQVATETVALDRIRDADLVNAVRRLPRRYRSLIALRYGAGLPATEVADLLGITRMAVAKATRRALDQLRADVAHLRPEQ